LTSPSLNWTLSLTPKRNARVLKSIWMVFSSTHGRVRSAVRTRVGQPTDQVIPGTRKVTSDQAPPDPSIGLSGECVGSADRAKSASTDRNRARMEGSLLNLAGSWIARNDFAFKPQFGHRRQHLLGIEHFHFVRDAEKVFFQIHLEGRDAWKPCQGFMDPIGSVPSGNVEPLAHILDVQRDAPRVCQRGGGILLRD
jgi:hypothetical protein